MRGSRLTTLLLLLCPLALAHQALADTSDPKTQFTAQQYEDLAKTIVAMAGISPDSKIKDRLLQKIINPTAQRNYSGIQGSGTVIKHLKFDEGISFPTEKEIAKAREYSNKFKHIPAPVVERSAQKMSMILPKEKEQALREHLIEERASLFTPKSITACREDKTLSVPNNAQIPQELKANIDEDQEVLFDILYLSPNAPPVVDKLTGPDELFGKSTMVHIYRDQMGDYPSLLASQNKIECLPFRLRVTQDKIFHYYGRDALKNYDKSEKGEFHFHVKNKLNRFM